MERGILQLQRRCAGVEWECAAAISSCFNARLWLGEVRQIAERAPVWSRDAGRVGNVFSAVTADLYTGFAHLAHGDAAGARALCEEAIARWSHAGYHFQHWLAFKIQTWSRAVATSRSMADARASSAIYAYKRARAGAAALLDVGQRPRPGLDLEREPVLKVIAGVRPAGDRLLAQRARAGGVAVGEVREPV